MTHFSPVAKGQAFTPCLFLLQLGQAGVRKCLGMAGAWASAQRRKLVYLLITEEYRARIISEQAVAQTDVERLSSCPSKLRSFALQRGCCCYRITSAVNLSKYVTIPRRLGCA